MAKNKIYSLVSILCLTIFMFVQIGANYCHTDECHQQSHKIATGTHIEKSSDDCSICHLQLNQHLYYQDYQSFSFDNQLVKSFYTFSIPVTSLSTTEAIGRAPPLS